MSSNPGSIFSPETFLDAATTQESIKRPPLPAGTTVQSLIKSLKSRTWQGKQDPTKGGIAIDVVHEIDLTGYPDLQKLVGGLPSITINDSIMLDLTEAQSIDYSPGKNAKLRRYREACNLNEAGKSFSIRLFEGRMVLAKIKHRPYEGDVFDEIDSVAKIS